MILGVRVSFSGIMSEDVDVSVMTLTVLMNNQEHMSLTSIGLQCPKKVGTVKISSRLQRPNEPLKATGIVVLGHLQKLGTVTKSQYFATDHNYCDYNLVIQCLLVTTN